MHRKSLNLLLVGLDLRRNNLHEVEKAVKHLTQDKIVNRCKLCYGQYGLGILSTCNRFELYLISYSKDENHLLELFSESNIDKNSLYIKSGEDAVKHLIEVACGGRSIAFGEAEILDQVKEAPTYGNNIFLQGIRTLFQKTHETAKMIREKLDIDGDNSLGKIAVQLLSSKLEDKNARITVVGYGTVGKKVVNELQKQGLSNIIVTTRKPEKITVNTRSLKVKKLDNLPEILTYTDAVITATSSTNYLISDKTVKNIPKGRRVIIIDIALPRNVDPHITLQHENIEIYNIEDLIPVAEQLSPYTEKMEELSKIAGVEARRLFRGIKALEAEEIIKDIRRWVEEIRVKELTKTLQLLTGDINHDREVVEMLSHRLVNRILHGPTVAIRQMAHNGYSQDYLDIIRKAFGVVNEADS